MIFSHFRRRYFFFIFFFLLAVGCFFAFRGVGYDMQGFFSSLFYNNNERCGVRFVRIARQLLGSGMCGYIHKIAGNFAAVYNIKWIKVTLLLRLCVRMFEQILKLV